MVENFPPLCSKYFDYQQTDVIRQSTLHVFIDQDFPQYLVLPIIP